MSTSAPAAPRFSGTRRLSDRVGDRLLLAITVLAALVAIAAIVLIIYKLVDGASASISKFGIAFVWQTTWNPSAAPTVHNANVFGAGVLLFGTVVTSGIALLLVVPLGIGIGVYLSLIAPGRVGAVVGPLVELLAAVPSVIIGLWGIFGAASTTGLGILTAGVALAIMVLPIMAAISRDLFLSVPHELKDGALALGSTRWEMIRGVVLDSSRAGLAAAAILGLSRALGEAIAVTQLIGAGNVIGANLNATGDTFASRIAEQFIGSTGLWTSSLFYCAVILLVMELAVNFAAQMVVRRFERRMGLAAR